jgi:hypothetical protein
VLRPVHAAHQERQLAEREAAGDAYVDQDFSDELGGIISPYRLTEGLNVLRAAAKIRPGRLHEEERVFRLPAPRSMPFRQPVTAHSLAIALAIGP